MVAVESWAPSRYKVATWLNAPELDVVPELSVSTTWCHFPLFNDPQLVGDMVAAPIVAFTQPDAALMKMLGLFPPVPPPEADSSVTPVLVVVLNQSSSDCAPEPPKYPPGMVICEPPPENAAAGPSASLAGPVAPS